MCGICGFLDDGAGYDRAERISVIKRQAGTLSHRGPDQTNYWMDDRQAVALGHTRLSIIDLSDKGAQPMHSKNQRYCLSYNGEIYNFKEIRERLRQNGVNFSGDSDTEVLLEACAYYGLEKTVEQLVGMFAFALWDRQEGALFLVRDRLGVKPLYWAQFGALFLFGSELKALRAHPGWRPGINRDAVAAYMRYNYVPAPHTIYTGVFKLAPGHILKHQPGKQTELHQYWRLDDAVLNGARQGAALTETELMNNMAVVMESAVSSRMIADVGLGAFLSGGVDSSMVVALMQKNSMRPVKTFSIGFHEQGYNEAEYAKKVAHHLGTEHTECYVQPDDALAVIPGLPDYFDEPFADSSQIPTYLISRLISRHVTVALSGDGGDEVFAGYDRYYFADTLSHRLAWLTPAGRYALRRIIHACSPGGWDTVFKYLPYLSRIPQAGDKLYKLAGLLLGNKAGVYRRLVSQWDEPDSLVINGNEPAGVLPEQNEALSGLSSMEQMQYLDTMTYLPDDILTKVDRASMAVSLEARVPLLDHRVVEAAWSLPQPMKMRKADGPLGSKWALRQMLYQYVPPALVDRPKMGFGVPIDNWLRGPLREWAADLLDEHKMIQQGILNPAPVQRRWREHLSGQRNRQHSLWGVLMFQAWRQRWMG